MSSVPHNLTRETTSFIGRIGELGQITALLADGARIVTATGPPGIGKSRLASHFAWRAADSDQWAGGIWWCDLSGVTTTPELARAIADACRVETGGEPVSIGHIAEVLGGRPPSMLIVDGVDDVLPLIRDAAPALSDAIQLLVCARERLGLTGEWCVALGPLALPATSNGADSEAVRLLVERARAHGHALTPSPGDPPDDEVLSNLARALGGNPLALELAAARFGLMAPRQLLERMPHRFELLRTTSPTPRSLWTAIEASWHRLTDEERSVFAQLCVFGAPIDLSDAEGVVVAATPANVLDVLDALVRKSLVHGLAAPTDGGRQLSVYENLRAFGRAKLLADAEQLEGTVDRHARWALTRATTLATRLQRTGAALTPSTALELATPADKPLTREIDNLLTAVNWAVRPELLSPERVARAMDLLLRLLPALQARGPIHRTAAAFQAVLAHHALTDCGLGTRVAVAYAETLYLAGRGDEAASLLNEGREQARQHGMLVEEARFVHALGASYFYGRADVERGDLEEAGARFEAAGHEILAADTTMRLGRVFEHEGRVSEAFRCYDDAMERARRLGQPRRVAIATLNLGALHAHLGHHDQAVSRYRVALDRSRQLLDMPLEAVTLANLGITAFERHEDARAREYFQSAATLGRQLGFGRVEATSLIHLGLLDHIDGDAILARSRYGGALARWDRSWPDEYSWSLLMLARAVLAAQDGATDAADRTLSAMALAHQRHPTEATTLLGALAELGVRAVASGGLATAVDAALDAAAAPLRSLRHLPRTGAHEIRAALRLYGVRSTGQDALFLAVAADGRAFVPPRGARVELGRRGPARRILAELARAAEEAPGEPVPIERLFAVAWPGEVVDPQYRTNRVYVAIADLRKLGLAPYLLHAGAGYLLDPTVPVVLTDR